jgi:gamma-glutamyltranspeptidase/glutathione hydrolase
MALKDGQVWMPFGTPGGDVQCQSMVQLFLNIAEFGMDPQQAIEAPRVSTWSFPNSFWPHPYLSGLVGVEGRIDPQTVAELRRRGHQVEVWDDWTPRMGSLCAIEVDRQRGALRAGADLRRDGYAIGR